LKRNENKKSPVSVLCSALGTALLILLIVVCVPLTGPKLLGYQTYTVISGSMEPDIPVGSIVYVKGMEPGRIQVKDVIAYYGGRDADAVITHRVMENCSEKGEFITKGDANLTEDMNPVKYKDLIGRVELVIPKLGILAQFLTGLEGKITAGCMIGLSVILHLLAGILDKKQTEIEAD